jgi:hypothetical protein
VLEAGSLDHHNVIGVEILANWASPFRWSSWSAPSSTWKPEGAIADLARRG